LSLYWALLKTPNPRIFLSFFKVSQEAPKSWKKNPQFLPKKAQFWDTLGPRKSPRKAAKTRPKNPTKIPKENSQNEAQNVPLKSPLTLATNHTNQKTRQSINKILIHFLLLQILQRCKIPNRKKN
jgi:hypothetical protein